jgi:hypothetical protein
MKALFTLWQKSRQACRLQKCKMFFFCSSKPTSFVQFLP